MTSKRKLMMTLMSIMVVLTLCFSLALPVFADDPPEDAKAAVTKIFKMPMGTSVPDATFTFDFEKKNVDGDSSTTAKNSMPDLSATVSFVSDKTTGKTDDGSVITLIRESADFVAGKNWPHAGVYEYLLTENKTGYTTPNNAGYTDDLTYSDAQYKVQVVIENGPNGLYVSLVAVTVVVVDNPGQQVDDKVDPTPGGDPNITGDYSKVVFTNTYLKNYGGTDPDSNMAMDVEKIVDGAQGDRSKYFDFKVSVFNPGTIPGNTNAYMAYIKEANGSIATDITNNVPTGSSVGMSTDTSSRPYLLFAPGIEGAIRLKHGQKLVFISLPVGASFIVKEDPVSKYTPTGVSTLGSASALTVIGTEVGGLTLPKYLVAEGANHVVVTNKHDTVVIAGISVDNLPYIVMIAIGMLALAGFLALKLSRKAKAER